LKRIIEKRESNRQAIPVPSVRLAEAEQAVIASRMALETEERDMRAEEKCADGYIVDHPALTSPSI